MNDGMILAARRTKVERLIEYSDVSERKNGMSQRLFFEILRRLRGTGTSKEIGHLAKQLYPDATLHMYIHDRPWKLQKWGYVRKNNDGSWSVVKEYP